MLLEALHVRVVGPDGVELAQVDERALDVARLAEPAGEAGGGAAGVDEDHEHPRVEAGLDAGGGVLRAQQQRRAGLVVEADELAQEVALARLAEALAADEAQPLDVDRAGARALELGIEVVLHARVAEPALEVGAVDGVQALLRGLGHRQQQLEHLLLALDAEDAAPDRREAPLVGLLRARPQLRRERAEARVGEQLAGWRARRRCGGRAGAEAVLLVHREDPARAFEQQPRLLAAAEVGRGVDEVRGRPVVARRERLRLALGVLPRQQLADRAAVAAGRQPVEDLGDDAMQDEVDPGGLVELAGGCDAMQRRQDR